MVPSRLGSGIETRNDGCLLAGDAEVRARGEIDRWLANCADGVRHNVRVIGACVLGFILCAWGFESKIVLTRASCVQSSLKSELDAVT